jgi:hypothetical protein
VTIQADWYIVSETGDFACCGLHTSLDAAREHAESRGLYRRGLVFEACDPETQEPLGASRRRACEPRLGWRGRKQLELHGLADPRAYERLVFAVAGVAAGLAVVWMALLFVQLESLLGFTESMRAGDERLEQCTVLFGAFAAACFVRAVRSTDRPVVVLNRMGWFVARTLIAAACVTLLALVKTVTVPLGLLWVIGAVTAWRMWRGA